MKKTLYISKVVQDFDSKLISYVDKISVNGIEKFHYEVYSPSLSVFQARIPKGGRSLVETQILQMAFHRNGKLNDPSEFGGSVTEAPSLTYYFENGSIRQQSSYVDGVHQKTTVYHENGKVWYTLIGKDFVNENLIKAG